MQRYVLLVKIATGLDSVLDSYEEQEFWMNRLDWVGIRLNKFGMFEERFRLLSRWKQSGFKFETSVVWKTWINSEKSKSLELTI